MSTTPRHLTRINTEIACVLAAACLTSCAAEQRPPLAPRPMAVPDEPAPQQARMIVRVDVAFGGIAVVPVGPSLEPAFANRPAQLTLDNGAQARIAWRWASAAVDDRPATPQSDEGRAARIARAWLGPVSTWITADVPVASAPGMWLAVLSLPRECDGRSLVLGSRTLQLRALDPSSRLAAPPVGGAWPHAAISLSDPMLAAARSAPGTRWWARLMSDGLRSRIARIDPAIDPAKDAATQAPPDVDRFVDPVLELWATQQEERWRWALDALAADDSGLARELVSRMGVVARIDGYAAPLAIFADPKLDQLRDVLLDRRRDARDRRNAVQTWLENQPASLAWIADDNSAIVTSDDRSEAVRAVVSVGIANLTGRPVVAWGGKLADQTADDASQVLTRVEAHAGSTLRVNCDVDLGLDLPPGQFPSPVRLAAHVGDDIVMCDAFASPIAVRPPGFLIPGLVADWNAASLLAAARETAVASPIDARTRGVLDRDENNVWTLRIDVADVATSEQIVRLWIGPRRESQTPGAQVRLRPSGLEPLIVEGSAAVRAVRAGDAWALRFSIPASEIDQQGVLRLAVERIGPGGRVSWPRPMLPWQMEPGRLALDLRAWDQVGRGR